MKQLFIALLTLTSLSICTYVHAQEQGLPGQEAAVAALQASTPKTIDEFMETGILYSKYWRNDLAKECYSKVLSLNPTDEDLLRLHEQATRLTPGYVDELREAPELQPVGGELADKIQAAQTNRFQSEQAIAQSVKDFLSAPWASEQCNQALGNLSRGGAPAAVALLQVLLQEDAALENKRKAATGLVRLDRSAQGPLIASLDALDPQFVAWCVAILGKRHDPDTASYLVGFTSSQCAPEVRQSALLALKQMGVAPSSAADSATALAQAAQRALSGKDIIAGESDGFIALWSWNEEQNKPVCSQQPQRVAQLLKAVRMARGAENLFPQNSAVKQIVWASEAEFLAAYPQISREMMPSVSLDALMADKKAESIEKINSLLDFSLKYGFSASAKTACQMLADHQSESALVNKGAQFSPLVRALTDGNPMVRWAACEAILKINPRNPYLGASQLPNTLAWFAKGEGRKKILIVSPKSADSFTIGGFLPDGYEPLVATTGKQALGILQTEPEIFAVLYSMESYSVPPGIFIEKIRAIPNANDIPVALMARVKDYNNARIIAGNTHPLTIWIPRPTSVQDMDRVLELVEKARPNAMPTEPQILEITQKALKFGADLAQLCYAVPYIQQPESVPSEDNKPKADNAENAKPEDKKAEAVKSKESIKPTVDYTRLAEKEVFRQMYDLTALAEAARYQLGRNRYAEDAIRLLENIPTQTAQTQILEYASNSLFPIQQRQLAVTGFNQSVTQYGILLDTTQLTHQYDLANGEKDASSQEILNSLLDIIETPWRQAQAAQKQAMEQSNKHDYPVSGKLYQF